MTIYPVAIPTLNRYLHFRNCIESLANCTHADQTELIISLDYPPNDSYSEGYNQIKKYIPQIVGFQKVTLIEQKYNLGPSGNWSFLAEYCFNNYCAYIATEDDNVFSPCFLDYMNHALERFSDDPKILSISGYNHVDFYNQNGYSTYLSKDSCAWGIGLWKEKEKKYYKDFNYYKKVVYSRQMGGLLVNTYPALYSMLSSMVKDKRCWEDVMRATVNILEGYYQLQPSISLVRNTGFDGSGVNCGSENNQINTQLISTEKTFDIGKEIGPCDTEPNRTNLFYQCINSSNQQLEIDQIFSKYKENTSLLFSAKVQIRRLFQLLHLPKNHTNSTTT